METSTITVWHKCDGWTPEQAQVQHAEREQICTSLGHRFAGTVRSTHTCSYVDVAKLSWLIYWKIIVTLCRRRTTTHFTACYHAKPPFVNSQMGLFSSRTFFPEQINYNSCMVLDGRVLIYSPGNHPSREGFHQKNAALVEHKWYEAAAERKEQINAFQKGFLETLPPNPTATCGSTEGWSLTHALGRALRRRPPHQQIGWQQRDECGSRALQPLQPAWNWGRQFRDTLCGLGLLSRKHPAP